MSARRARQFVAKLFALALVGVAACGRPAGPAKHGAAKAPAKPSASASAKASAIDALAAKVVATTPAAGVGVAVVWHGETVVAKGYGLADADARVATDADTVFRIGSITKQFTAAAILQLAAQGRLSLDDDIVRHLPDYPTRGRTITLRALLTHTSGVRDYEHGVPWFAEHMAEPRPGAELVAKFAAEPLDFEPGTHWAYSNSGYYLLGLVIERVTGQTYPDYVRDHVLAPAGVAGIRYCPDEQRYPHAAQGYDVEGGKRVPARPIAMVYAFSAGALCATAGSLIAWGDALAHGRVVAGRAWREMITPATLSDGRKTDYGLGLFRGELGGHPVIFHGGGINGFVSTLAYYPADELYVAVLVNTDGAFADDLGEAIAREVLGVPAPAVVDLAIGADEARAVAARYPMLGMATTIVIEAGDGALFMRRDGGKARRRLLLQGDGGYVVEGTKTRLAFDRDRGRVVRVRLTRAGVTFEGSPTP